MAAVDAHHARSRGGFVAELGKLGGSALIPDELGERRGQMGQRGSPERGDCGAPRACSGC
jgi:hypothetical protein